MNAKQYLLQVRGLRAEIAELEDERRSLIDRFTRITPSLSESVSSTKDPHKYDALAIADERIDRALSADYDRIEKIRREVDKIAGDRAELYRAILIGKYFNGKTFQELGDQCGYCKRQIERLHGAALRAFERDNNMSLNVVRDGGNMVP